MKKNKLLSYTTVLLLSAQLFSFGCNACEVEAAAPVSSNTATEASIARSDDIRWVIKTENGKTYKRLYNFSTGEWIGDWILIG